LDGIHNSTQNFSFPSSAFGDEGKVISEYESAESLFGFRDPDSWIQESPGPESYSGLGVRVLGNL
jgi:hypothetical protein